MSLKPTTPTQFTLIRFVMGVCLLVYFFCTLVFAKESISVLDETSLVFPDPFWPFRSPVLIFVSLGLGAVFSVSLILGWKRRLGATGLCLIWSYLFAIDVLVGGPAVFFTGLLLLLLSVLPGGEPKSLDAPVDNWVFPIWAHWGLLILLMGGYTVGGVLKLGAEDWMAGTAFTQYLDLTGRDFATSALSLVPLSMLKGLTWVILGLEILALPLVLFQPSRRWIWLALLCVNLFVIVIFKDSGVTFGTLMMHAFCFHQGWLPPARSKTNHPIVYFDGVCSLCNHAVDFLMAEDHEQQYHFASIQSEAGKGVDSSEVQSGKTMALQDGDLLYLKSEAVLRAAAGLGGHWRVVSWLRVVPRPIRDAVYMLVSNNRYVVFGKRDTCRMPTAEERARFLS